jgi:arsenite methyltransferase
LNDFNRFIDELPLWSAPFGLKLLDCLIFKPRATVIDIGCGEGFPITEIAARFGRSGRFFGVEPLTEPLERFQLKKRRFDLPTTWPVRAVAETLPFRSHSADLIVSNNGLNNVSDLTSSLNECRRIIKADGQMVITVNTQDTMKEFYDIFRQVLTDLSTDAEQVIAKQILAKRLTWEQWQQLLKESGFMIKNTVKDRFVLSFADSTTLMEYHLIRHFFRPGWQKLVPQDQRADVFSQVGARLDEIAENEGCIRQTVPFMVMDCRPESAGLSG